MSKPNYKKVEVNIPFVKFAQGESFEGTIQKEDVNDKGERFCIGETSEGELVKLGGFQVMNFFDNFYNGKQCRITFKEKTTSKSGREVNLLEFEQEVD